MHLKGLWILQNNNTTILLQLHTFMQLTQSAITSKPGYSFFPLNARLDGQNGRPGHSGQEINLLVFPGFKPLIVQAVA